MHRRLRQPSVHAVDLLSLPVLVRFEIFELLNMIINLKNSISYYWLMICIDFIAHPDESQCRPVQVHNKKVSDARHKHTLLRQKSLSPLLSVQGAIVPNQLQ